MNENIRYESCYYLLNLGIFRKTSNVQKMSISNQTTQSQAYDHTAHPRSYRRLIRYITYQINFMMIMHTNSCALQCLHICRYIISHGHNA